MMTRKVSSLAIYVVLSVGIVKGQGFPPVVTKSFTPVVVAVNQVSTLTITLTNRNAFSLLGASISDTFPVGLIQPSPGTASTTCGAGFLANSFTSISMVNGTIPANGSCTIIAAVLSASAGSYQNDTGSLFTGSGSSLGGGSATLVVVPPSQIPALSDASLLVLCIILGMTALRRVA